MEPTTTASQSQPVIVFSKTEQTQSIGKLSEALSKAQGEMHGAKKDSANPFFKSKYADLQSVWDACRAALSAHGLAIIQIPSADAANVTVSTILAHASGEWIRGELTMRPVKNDPQGIGSCITYARRYALSAMAGVCQEDDDGNGASGQDGRQVKSVPQPSGKPSPLPDETGFAENLQTKKSDEGVQDHPQDAGAVPGTWQEVKVHIGSPDMRGKRLGDLDKLTLEMLQKNFKPTKSKSGGKFSDADLTLRAALDASVKESGGE